ncbi:hypothetical protein AO398_23575 [Methylobacterium sp. GXS13]|nr:hypothetical protein AO398_23575 [Methylobacterium sp. GXS13]
MGRAGAEGELNHLSDAHIAGSGAGPLTRAGEQIQISNSFFDKLSDKLLKRDAFPLPPVGRGQGWGWCRMGRSGAF